MIRYLLLFAFLFINFPIWPKNLEIFVRDSDLSMPLKGAKVMAEGVTKITNSSGIVSYRLNLKKIGLVISYPGYVTRKLTIEIGSASSYTVDMHVKEMSGKDLYVVKKRRVEQNESRTSEYIDNRVIRNTAQIGIFEDITTSIKLLPGISYGGLPSIRGGDPYETTYYLDGAPIIFPYHWGGLVSIFDPNYVDSVNLFDGAISAKYGQVTSGLIDVTSKSPLVYKPETTFEFSTTGLDAWSIYHFLPSLAVIAGAKTTWMQIPFTLYNAAKDFSPIPYLFDSFMRIEDKPSTNLEANVDFYIGQDGFNQTSPSTVDLGGLRNFLNKILYASGRFKWLITDKELVSGNMSFNGFTTNDVLYNQYGQSTYDYHQTICEYNSSIEFETDLSNQILALGLDGNVVSSNNIQSYFPTLDFSGNNLVQIGSYIYYKFSVLKNMLQGEAGLRLQQTSIMKYLEPSINTYDVNPRFQVQLNFFRNDQTLRLNIHTGTGVYTEVPWNTLMWSSASGSNIVSQDFQSEHCFSYLIGSTLTLFQQYSITLDGYYRYLWDRYFLVPNVVGNNSQLESYFQFNGTGYSSGIELTIKKEINDFWSGWISYSFNFAKYLNPDPSSTDFPFSDFPSIEPLGVWYSPNFQRYHNLNLILNWNPNKQFTLTTTGTFATGVPTFDGLEPYSDSQRSSNIYSLNIKADWRGLYGEKIGWEFYFAIQNILVDIFPSSVVTVANNESNFNLGYPVPSFGYKLIF